MSEVVLFSTGCPKCVVLRQKLDDANIPYVYQTDVQELMDMGILSAPVLKVNNTYLAFRDAVNWVNEHAK